jgi:ribonuclease HI
VVKQVTGSYQVKNLALKQLHGRVLALRKEFTRFRIEHVPRADNAAADRLANLAIDQRSSAGSASPGPLRDPG